LGIFILVAWLHYVSTRLVISVRIARRDQNLSKMEALASKARNGLLEDLEGQSRTSASKSVEQILIQLRALNARQGLAVRLVFGIASSTLTLSAVITASITINPAAAITIFSIALIAVAPSVLLHGGKVVAIEREFRAFTALSASSFKKLASAKLRLESNGEDISFQDESNNVSANFALLRRLVTPDWNRVIATTTVAGVMLVFLVSADLVGYPAPPGGTILVLILALFVVLAQIAALSRQVTSLGRFLDSIEYFEKGSVQLENSNSQTALDLLLLNLRTVSGGSQETEED
jgi:hypothetical protein